MFSTCEVSAVRLCRLRSDSRFSGILSFCKGLQLLAWVSTELAASVGEGLSKGMKWLWSVMPVGKAPVLSGCWLYAKFSRLGISGDGVEL
jgi:hypothetical protein